MTGHARLSLDSAGTTTTRFAIYADSAGEPGALLAQSDTLTLTSTTEAERVFTFSGANLITVTNGTPYWIGPAWNDPGTPSVVVSRDNTGSMTRQQAVTTGPVLPDPYGTPTATSAGPIDAYVTFTPSTVTKTGSDPATGASSGGVAATSTPAADTATGAEAGSIAMSSGDTGTGGETGFVAQQFAGGDTSTGVETGTSSATLTPPIDTAAGSSTGGTTAAITPPIDTAAGAEQGHIAIPGADSAAGADAHVPPTLVTVTTGEAGTGSEGGYVETLFGDLIVNLYGIDPDTDELVALPDYIALDFSRERNSKGAVSASYPAEGKGFDLLRACVTDNRDLEFELWTNGTPTGALRGYLQEAAGDDVTEEGTWSFAGSFLEKRADEVLVYPQSRGVQVVDPDTGELVWTNPAREYIVNADTPGAVVITLLEQAQGRDSWEDITWDFTTTHDSNGIAWGGLLTAKFSPGISYAQIFNKMVDLHLVEWAIIWDSVNQQKVLKLWGPEGRGADLTLGPRPVTLRRGRNLLDAPRKWSVADAATTVLAAGSEGIYDDATDATALARRGRRVEAYTSLGQASDEAAVLAWAQAELATLAPGLQSIEHGIGMLPGEPRPIIAYDIGDWLLSQSGVEPERLRVVQWTLSIDDQRNLSGTTTLNDLVRDAVERLRERMNAITSGEAIAGTSEPGAQTEDRTPPAAPEGVVATSIAYQDPDVQGLAQTLAMVTVGWLPVTSNADGADNPLVQAAVFILDKIEDEIANPEVPDPEEEDGGPDYDPISATTWTWKNCPQLVRDFAAPLRALWVTDGSPDRVIWLTAYIAETTATPTAADDVAGYDVRYSYLGIQQVGGLPTSDPFPEDERFYYQATPAGGVTSTQYSFGGVEGGSLLRIEVRAFDRSGNYGAWTTIFHDASNDNTPPPVPSTPIAKIWFRTLDVSWDGLGAEGEVMPFDFAGCRVWLGQGADMTMPAEPQLATEFDPLLTTPQYVRDIPLGAGTTNIADLPIGVGWFVALQAVDRTGNASARSVVAGPFTAEQLVGQDLIDDIITANLVSPNSIESAHIINGAITTAKIVDAAIVSAKIGTAQINSAHIASVSAGSIITGTMTATLTVTGSLWTSLDTNATRLGFSGAGLQLYKTNSPSGGSTLVGEWKTSDGSMLVTGTFRSGTVGQRIHIDTDGTISMFPTAGTNKSTITNESGEMVWRGPLTSSKSGRLNVNTLGVGLNYSQEGNLLASISSEFVLFDRRMRATAPYISLEVDESFTSPVGGVNSGRRIQFGTLNSSGSFITDSGISYFTDSDDWGGMAGNDTGWKLAAVGPSGAGRFVVTSGTLNGSGVGWATAWDNPSSAEVKEDIQDARALVDPLETIRNARARKFRYTQEGPTGPERVGVIAEELPEVLHSPITLDGQTIIGLSTGTQIGVLWGAFNQVLDQEIVSTSGIAVLLRSQLGVGGIMPAGATVEVPVTWESVPPAAPTGGFVQIHSTFVWAGRVTAWIKTGSVTTTGATVVFKNISTSNVVVNENTDALRVSATAIGLGLYTPPYVPPEAP